MRLNLRQYLDIDRNEYQESFLGVKTAGAYLPPSCANCLRNSGASTSWNPKGLSKTCSGKALLLPYLEI